MTVPVAFWCCASHCSKVEGVLAFRKAVERAASEVVVKNVLRFITVILSVVLDGSNVVCEVGSFYGVTISLARRISGVGWSIVGGC